jgi:hypothetical protein
MSRYICELKNLLTDLRDRYGELDDFVQQVNTSSSPLKCVQPGTQKLALLGRASQRGTTISQLLANYRALGASVLAFRADACAEKMSLAEVVRFNEPIAKSSRMPGTSRTFPRNGAASKHISAGAGDMIFANH